MRLSQPLTNNRYNKIVTFNTTTPQGETLATTGKYTGMFRSNTTSGSQLYTYQLDTEWVISNGTKQTVESKLRSREDHSVNETYNGSATISSVMGNYTSWSESSDITHYNMSMNRETITTPGGSTTEYSLKGTAGRTWLSNGVGFFQGSTTTSSSTLSEQAVFQSNVYGVLATGTTDYLYTSVSQTDNQPPVYTSNAWIFPYPKALVFYYLYYDYHGTTLDELPWANVTFGATAGLDTTTGPLVTPQDNWSGNIYDYLEPPPEPPAIPPSRSGNTSGPIDTSWWGWTKAMGGGGIKGAMQIGANTVNGLQDGVVGILNIGLVPYNCTTWLVNRGFGEGTGIHFWIPSPDWSRDWAVQEYGTPGGWDDTHGWSKFAGSMGLGAATAARSMAGTALGNTAVRQLPAKAWEGVKHGWSNFKNLFPKSKTIPREKYPKPQKWDESWEWGPASGEEYAPQWRWWDPKGGEWRYHGRDKYHTGDAHWDYNPWDQWNSQWNNVPISSPPPPTVTIIDCF